VAHFTNICKMYLKSCDSDLLVVVGVRNICIPSGFRNGGTVEVQAI